MEELITRIEMLIEARDRLIDVAEGVWDEVEKVEKHLFQLMEEFREGLAKK